MSGNAIPGHRRQQVKDRERNRCFRCAGPGAEWHHRRTRRIADAHQHCPCNGLWLCTTCHKWAHDHPFEAKAEGLIVSRYEREPGNVEATAYFGPVVLKCDGMWELPEMQEEG